MNYILRKTSQSSLFFILLLLFLLFCFQPSFATPTTPTSDFIDNGDGTVTHKLTGLVWMRCSMGQTWDKANANCTGTAATYTWDAAMALKSNFAGHSDWRVPNQVELNTIVERDTYYPAINNTVFPNMQNAQTGWFLSSSPRAYYYSSDEWKVSFSDGQDNFIYGYDKSYSYPVRLVRSGQCFGIGNQTSPSTSFMDNGDGTLTHKCTGLVWQRCAIGQTWDGVNKTCTGIATTYSWDAAMALKNTFAGKTDWRLPNANELFTIVDYSRANPSMNTALFPNALSNLFWSSSLLAANSGYAWIVDFANGNSNRSGDGEGIKSNSNAVRLVRGGQFFGSTANLDMTNANCRYVAPFYNSIWQQMKTKNAPSCGAVLRYHTWLNFTRPQNYAVINYYNNRLDHIDTTQQLLATSLEGIDKSFESLGILLDLDLQKILTQSDYQITANTFKTKGMLSSLNNWQSPFKLSTKTGRSLNRFFTNTAKTLVVGKVTEASSSWLCNALLDGAVAQSCATESAKIANCAIGLATTGVEAVSDCVLGSITTSVGLIENIYDIGQVVATKKYNYGYILINNYLNDYYAKGSAKLPYDDAKLEAEIQKYVNKLSLSSGGLFTFADFDMQFVKNGIRNAITRNNKTVVQKVTDLETARALLNNLFPIKLKEK